MIEMKYTPPHISVIIIKSEARILAGSHSINYSNKDEYADPDLEVL